MSKWDKFVASFNQSKCVASLIKIIFGVATNKMNMCKNKIKLRLNMFNCFEWKKKISTHKWNVLKIVRHKYYFRNFLINYFYIKLQLIKNCQQLFLNFQVWYTISFFETNFFLSIQNLLLYYSFQRHTKFISKNNSFLIRG